MARDPRGGMFLAHPPTAHAAGVSQESQVETLVSAATIGAAAAACMSLWTFRVALATRGRRVLSAAIAGVEATLFVVIFADLITSLDDPVRIGGYALGVTCGAFLGMFADERLSVGRSEIRLILPGDGAEPIDRLLEAGWPATWTAGSGPAGPTTTVFLAVDDRRQDELLRLVDTFDPAPFVTVERLREARPAPLPAGYVQVGGARTRASRRGGRR